MTDPRKKPPEAHDPAETHDQERARAPRLPSPARTGTIADALLDDAAGAPKSETEEALDRATRERPADPV